MIDLKLDYKRVLPVLLSVIFFLSSCGQKKEMAASQESIYSQKYEWKMATSWPPNFPILGEGANMIAQMVEEMSGGQMKIKVYGGGELIPALGVFDAVSQGSIEMGHSAPYYWAGKIPEAVFFATVPFGLQGSDMSSWLLSDEAKALWAASYAPHNVVPFLAGNSDTQMGGWFRKEINSIEDFKGLKMRIPGLGGKVVSKAGGSAMNVAAGEIYTNLERGVIDATEWIGPSHDKTMGFDKVAKYYYYPGWHEPGTTFELTVNKQQFDALPKHLQKIIEAASSASALWVHAQFEMRNAQVLAQLKEEGIEMRRFPDEVLKQLKQYTDETLQEMLAENPNVKPIYESLMKAKAQFRDWNEVKKLPAME